MEYKTALEYTKCKKKCLISKVDEWNTRAKALIYPEKFDLWKEHMVNRIVRGKGMQTERILKIMELADSGATMPEIMQLIVDYKAQNNIVFEVLKFSKRGPQIFKETYELFGKKMSPSQQVLVANIEKQNAELELKHRQLIK